MKKLKISIIIRTCGRPQILRNALQSIRKQTYGNIEVIVIEDGDNLSENLVQTEFSDLDIVYRYTGEKKGRCYVGNLGLRIAQGDYFNFLDDDDILLENHVEILVNKILEKKCEVVYAIAEEHQIIVKNKGQHVFDVKRKLIRYKQPFNKLLLCYLNYLPIQCVMFSRALYEKFGGFDEKLNLLEDWDLWVRYAMACYFEFIPEVTSIYYTPYKDKKKKIRDVSLRRAEREVLEKLKSYEMCVSVRDVNQEMGYILNVFAKKGIWFYLQKIKNYLLYKDL